jgi:REP element-mobilizing transposase RayT
VTFRLADSLPASALERFRFERANIVFRAQQTDRDLTSQERTRLEELYSERVQAWLDAGHGACHLRHPEIAGLVRDALSYFEDVRHRIHAWCIMPNHVHVIVQPLGTHSLSRILNSWKGFTGNRACAMLGISAPFWMKESYDHIVRDARDYEHQLNYVLSNPTRAGLRNWPWVWRSISTKRATDLQGTGRKPGAT